MVWTSPRVEKRATTSSIESGISTGAADASAAAGVATAVSVTGAVCCHRRRLLFRCFPQFHGQGTCQGRAVERAALVEEDHITGGAEFAEGRRPVRDGFQGTLAGATIKIDDRIGKRRLRLAVQNRVRDGDLFPSGVVPVFRHTDLPAGHRFPLDLTCRQSHRARNRCRRRHERMILRRGCADGHRQGQRQRQRNQ